MISYYRISRSIAFLKWISIPFIILATITLIGYQALVVSINRTNTDLAMTYTAQQLDMHHRATVQPTIAQGDMVYTQKHTTTDSEPTYYNCTIGYIDRKTRRAYTAAHCGDDKLPVTSNKKNT